MRTKHILTAMVLPALFAACTADDFEVVNNVATDSQRPEVSGVTLNVVGDAETRYAVDDNGSSLKFTYQNGDQIGAAIIDNYDANHPDEPSRWPIIYSQGGVCNPFTYNANTGEWSTINSVGVGHYIFVYPYDKTNLQRHAVSYNLPIIQELYQDENGAVDLNATIAKNNQAIYSDLLDEDDLNIEATMRNLFTYPTFRVNLDNGERVNTVSQIVLEYDYKFVVKGGLDHQKVFDIFSNKIPTYWVSPSNQVTDWDKVQTNDFLLDNTVPNWEGYLADGQNGTSKYLIAKFPKNTRFKLDSNTANKYVDVRFMMPGSLLRVNDQGAIVGGDYNGTLKMHIYTDNGVYTIPDVVQAITFSNTTDYEVREKVLARNASYSLTLSKEDVTPGNENFIVTTVEDWNNLVDEYGASTNYGSSNPLSVQIIGDDFSFNGDVKYPSKAYFEVKTDAKVTGDVTIKHVIFDYNTTITVEEDATLTTDATLNIRNAEIENNGTVNIAPVAANQEPYRISEITNNGTLNIAEKSVARFRLVNEKNGKVENAGEIATYGENKGEINNKGMIETIAFFYNDRRTEWKNNKEVVIYEGTINNNGTIRSTAGRIYNGSIINNNGRLTCQSLGGTIENEYRLYSAKGATTYITINNATVVVEEAIPNNSVVITTQSGKVQYTAVNATENFKSGSVTSIVNSVIAKGDLTISNLGNVNALTINGAATLKLPAKAKIATVNANANTVLASDLEVTSMLKVAANTTVKVNAGVTLDVNSMDNDGVIDVAGTFTANMSGNEPGAGVVEESFGNNSQVIWEKNPANQAAKTYQTAINAAVKAWAQDGNLSTATVNVLSYNLKAKNAATTFEAYVNGTTSAANTELKDAYDAYRRVESGVTLTSGYNAAVTELMKRESEKTFTEMVKTLTYTDIVIYENASKALEGFKAAVAGNRVGGISTQLDKVVICTSTTNYAPEQSQIKKSDVIYTIFGDDAINLVSDWTSILSRAFDHSASNASAWDVDVVKDWISRVASTTNANSSLILEAAKDFITTNNLLQASRGWKYAPEQIQAVLLAQEYNK